MAVDKPAFAAVTAQAPAGIGNLGVGFDILGQALESPHDQVTIRVRARTGVEIVSVSGVVTELPADPRKNSATAGVLRMLDSCGASFGLEIEIEKGISLGSGMGGSAASAVAGVVAAAELLGFDKDPEKLLTYALDGEEAATGARHADNAASALTGGVVLVANHNLDYRLIKIPTPENIYSVLVHPHIKLETRKARAVLPEKFEKQCVIQQSAHLAGFMAACFNNDRVLLARSLQDVLIEPFRGPLIKGFDDVKAAALDSGALGCSISGGGPSVFAWCHGKTTAQQAGQAMQGAFEAHGVASDLWVSNINAPGAQVVSTCAM